MRDDMNPIEQTASDAADFAMLQLDKLKLRLLDNFATLFNTLFSVLILMILAGIVVMFLSVALVLALSAWIGSLLIAVLIVAAFFLLIAVVVYIYRDKLIVNPAVRVLGKVMFEKNKDSDDE